MDKNEKEQFEQQGIYFNLSEPNQIVFHGTPIEIMQQKMLLSVHSSNGSASIATLYCDDLFFMFEKEFENKALQEQNDYIDWINYYFYDTIKKWY